MEEMEKMITFLNSQQADGLIITPAGGSEVLIESVLEERKTLALLDRDFPQLDVPSVLINNYEICYHSTIQLIDQGYKNLAFITYRQDQFHTNERKREFVEAIEDVGLFNPDNVKNIQVLCFDVSYTIDLFLFWIPFIKQPIKKNGKESSGVTDRPDREKNAIPRRTLWNLN